MSEANCPIDSNYFLDTFNNAGSGNWNIPTDVIQGSGFIGFPYGVGSGAYYIPLLIPTPNLLVTNDFIEVLGEFTVNGPFGVTGISQHAATAGFVFGSGGGPLNVQFTAVQFDYQYSYGISGAAAVAKTFFSPSIPVEDSGFQFTIRVRITKNTYIAYINNLFIGSGSISDADYADTITLVICKGNSIQGGGSEYPEIRCSKVYIYGPSLSGNICIGPDLAEPPYPYCQLGKSFKYDAPVLFDDNFWARIANRAVTRFGDYASVVGSRYAAAHTTPTPLTYFSGDSYGASQETFPLDFDSVSFDVSSYFDSVVSGGSDNAGALFEVNYGLKIAISFVGGANYYITVSRFNNTLIYTSAPISIGSGTFTYSTTRNIRIEQTADGVYDVFVDGVQVVTALDASVDQGGAALGPKRAFLTSIFGTYDVSPNPRTIWWHRFSNIYLIGPGYVELFNAPVFSSGGWDGDGGGFDFGSTLKSKTSGTDNSSWLFKRIPNPAGLHAEMEYNFRMDEPVTIGGAFAYNGIGIAASGFLEGTHPGQNFGIDYGSWVLNTGGGRYIFVGVNNFPDYSNGSVIANTVYAAKTTIDLDNDRNITVRLEIPALSVDETRTWASALTLNSYLTIAGPWTLSPTNYIEITSLLATLPARFPSTCLGVGAGLSPGDGSQGGLTPYLSWFSVSGATSYQIQIYRDITLTNLALDKTVAVTHLDLVEQVGFIGFPLDFNLTFYWRIRSFKGQAASDWSPAVSYRPEDARLSFTPTLNHIEKAKALMLQQFKGGI